MRGTQPGCEAPPSGRRPEFGGLGEPPPTCKVGTGIPTSRFLTSIPSCYDQLSSSLQCPVRTETGILLPPDRNRHRINDRPGAHRPPKGRFQWVRRTRFRPGSAHPAPCASDVLQKRFVTASGIVNENALLRITAKSLPHLPTWCGFGRPEFSQELPALLQQFTQAGFSLRE